MFMLENAAAVMTNAEAAADPEALVLGLVFPGHPCQQA